GERDDALRRRLHVRPRGRAQIDPAMLPARIRTGTVEREGTKDGPVDGPRPRLRGCRQHERAERHHTDSSTHEAALVPGWRTARPSQGHALAVNTGYKVRR